MSLPCLTYSWVHGSNYKAPGHVEILWGHLKFISLNTLHSSFSTCHLPKLFLRKETQASTTLKFPKPIKFQFSTYCGPDRERHKPFFLKDLYQVVTFCFPLRFPSLPGLRTLCSCVYLWENSVGSLLFASSAFSQNLFYFLCMKFSIFWKDLDFWNSKVREKHFCFSHSDLSCLPWSIYYRAPSNFPNLSRNL